MTLPDGRRQILDFVLPGETIGIASGVFGAASHSVTMLTTGVICCFGPVNIVELLRSDPMCGEALLRSVSVECRTLERRLVELGQKNAEERLASLLYHLFLRSTDSFQGTPVVSTCFFPPTQRQLADATGLTPTHVSNTLSKLRMMKILDLSKKILTIHDHERLRHTSGSPISKLDKTFLI